MDNQTARILSQAIQEFQHGRFRESEAMVLPLLADPAASAPASRLYGLILEQDGNHADAARFIEAALSGLQSLDRIGALRDLARIFTHLGQSSQSSFYHHNAAIALFNAGYHEESVEHFRSAGDVTDISVDYLKGRAACLQHVADIRWESWRKLQIDCAVAALMLADTTDAEADWDSATAAWAKLPDDAARAAAFLHIFPRMCDRHNHSKHEPDIYMKLFRVCQDWILTHGSFSELAPSAYMCMHCSQPDPKLHYQLIGRWWREIKSVASPEVALPAIPDRTSGPLRIGIMDYSGVCALPHYRDTSILPAIKVLHADGLDISIYLPKQISVGAEVHDSCARVRQFPAWDVEAAKAINADALDILLVLNGFTPSAPTTVLMHCLARRQVVWHHTHTTFGPELFDATIYDPIEFTEAHQLVSYEPAMVLDRLPWLFAAPSAAPPVRPAPRHRNGHITFGIFNRLTKINLDLVKAWKQVLDRVPGSRLAFAGVLLTGPSLRSRLSRYFDIAEIPAERVDFLPIRLDHKDYLGLYNEVDISLDAFPFNGGMITFESLWQGVPVVSCYGEDQLARTSLAFLSWAGLPDLAVPGLAAYADRAVALAGDGQRLDDLRQTLRDRLLASPLMNSDGYATAMRTMFARILELPARSAVRGSADQ